MKLSPLDQSHERVENEGKVKGHENVLRFFVISLALNMNFYPALEIPVDSVISRYENGRVTLSISSVKKIKKRNPLKTDQQIHYFERFMYFHIPLSFVRREKKT